MPEKQVYLCDKTEGVEVSDKTKVCGRDVGSEPVHITFSYSVDGVPSVSVSNLFCSATHANFWLKRQRIDIPVDDSEDEESD